jgi:hypothetical protein
MMQAENPPALFLPVILSKLLLRSEGSGRAARSIALFAMQGSRV